MAPRGATQCGSSATETCRQPRRISLLFRAPYRAPSPPGRSLRANLVEATILPETTSPSAESNPQSVKSRLRFAEAGPKHIPTSAESSPKLYQNAPKLANAIPTFRPKLTRIWSRGAPPLPARPCCRRAWEFDEKAAYEIPEPTSPNSAVPSRDPRVRCPHQETSRKRQFTANSEQ